VLETAGYKVLIARSIHKALEIFRRNRVDLVLAEHIAPATKGGSALPVTMKGLKPDVPVVIYSADWAELPGDRFADMFISKLVSADELLRMIKSLLDKVRGRSRRRNTQRERYDYGVEEPSGSI